jgi:hypothetical protein
MFQNWFRFCWKLWETTVWYAYRMTHIFWPAGIPQIHSTKIHCIGLMHLAFSPFLCLNWEANSCMDDSETPDKQEYYIYCVTICKLPNQKIPKLVLQFPMSYGIQIYHISYTLIIWLIYTSKTNRKMSKNSDWSVRYIHVLKIIF